MLDFHKYLMRHGESWIQEIVEGIEQSEGIRVAANKTLEERWEAVMQLNQQQAQAA